MAAMKTITAQDFRAMVKSVALSNLSRIRKLIETNMIDALIQIWVRSIVYKLYSLAGVIAG